MTERQSYYLRYFRTEIIYSILDYLNRIVMCLTLPPVRRYGVFLDVKYCFGCVCHWVHPSGLMFLPSGGRMILVHGTRLLKMSTTR